MSIKYRNTHSVHSSGSLLDISSINLLPFKQFMGRRKIKPNQSRLHLPDTLEFKLNYDLVSTVTKSRVISSYIIIVNFYSQNIMIRFDVVTLWLLDANIVHFSNNSLFSFNKIKSN